MPSIVLTSPPSAWTARMVQLFTASPSRWTVHAPQFDVSQPTWVPVRPRRARIRWTSSRRGSASSSCRPPLTVRATWTVLIPLLSSAEPERRSNDRSTLSRIGCPCKDPRTDAVMVSRRLKGPPSRDDHGWEMPTASHAAPAAPAREVLVARQPVLDAEMNLLGFELLVDGAAVVADALSEIGLEQLTGGHAAWLPLGRELLLDVGPVPVRSDRVVLQVHAGEGEEDALLEAVRQLADPGACQLHARGGEEGALLEAGRQLADRGASVALDRVPYRPALEPLLDLAWG